MKLRFSQPRKSRETGILLWPLPHWFIGAIAILCLIIPATPTSLSSHRKSKNSLPDPSLRAISALSNLVQSKSSQRTSETPNPPAIASPIKVFQSTLGALSLSWTTCGSCPETPETTVSGNTVSVGVANRSFNQPQSMSIHGAAAALPASANYTITFDYDWFTFDSYSSPTEGYVGFWDSFSVSVASQRYWELPLVARV